MIILLHFPLKVVDASFMSLNKMNKFLLSELEDAKQKNLMVSLHLKATMMKVSALFRVRSPHFSSRLRI